MVDNGNGVSGTAHIFLSNVLGGSVSCALISPIIASGISATALTLADGFSHRTSTPAALVLGPSGLAYEASNDTLYVASSSDNAIYKIATATTTNSRP